MNTATTKQIEFINRLKGERQVVPELLELGRALWKQEKFSREAASVMIEEMLASPKTKTEQGQPVEVAEGIYEVDGKVYKVRLNQEGTRKYATVLEQHGETWKFDYAPGAMRLLQGAEPMSEESAKNFGVLYSICVNCARQLNDERSILAGYGPKCAERYGWSWGERPSFEPEMAEAG